MKKDIAATIVKAPYESEKKWYIKLKLNDADSGDILKFEKDFKESRFLTSFQHSVFNNIVVVKLPYRYKKFECEVFDRDGHFMSCYELKQDDAVSVSMEHVGFSIQKDEHVMSSWKTKRIQCI